MTPVTSVTLFSGTRSKSFKSWQEKRAKRRASSWVLHWKPCSISLNLRDSRAWIKLFMHVLLGYSSQYGQRQKRGIQIGLRALTPARVSCGEYWVAYKILLLSKKLFLNKKKKKKKSLYQKKGRKIKRSMIIRIHSVKPYWEELLHILFKHRLWPTITQQ